MLFGKIDSVKLVCAATALALLLSCCVLPDAVCAAEASDSLKWWQKTIVYEAYPSSFKDTDGDSCGDLQGLISELDYLRELGVGAIWLTPVYASPMGDNGYDVQDYRSINPRYGDMNDMDALIREAQARDIRIVMDLVFNHTSNECDWFLESSKDRENDKSDWYIWADPAEDGGAPNNWRSIFGGSAWTWCEARGQYYLHTFADFQPDLNWENEDVRNALFDIANFWADKGVGGFRVDAVTYIKKPAKLTDGPVDANDGMAAIHNATANTPGILDFLHEFKSRVADGRDIFMVGEANGVPADELKQWVGEDGVFDMIFEFSHVNVQFPDGREIWYQAVEDWKLTRLKKAFSDSQASLRENGWYPVFLENHDQPRSVNHFMPRCADPVAGAKALAVLMMTMRGTPFLYEGQELGMTNLGWNKIDMYNDISSHNQYNTALANGLSEDAAMECVQKYSRDNARSPMQWNTEANAGFTTGTPWLAVNDNYVTVNAASESADPDSVLNWYIRLNRLRKEHPVLIDGSYAELMADSEEVLAYVRENESEKIAVLINFTDHEVRFDADGFENGEILLSSTGSAGFGKLNPYQAVCISMQN